LTEKNATADKAFLDTNILYSNDEPEKQTVAYELISDQDSEYAISTQVIGEFINVLYRKLGYDIPVIKVAIDDFRENFDVAVIGTDSIDNALFIMEKYGFSYWDSMIISSALEAKCSVLYSEDLQHNQLIEQNLRIVSPFE
jgi:predicted nucleic acid-binding protein